LVVETAAGTRPVLLGLADDEDLNDVDVACAEVVLVPVGARQAPDASLLGSPGLTILLRNPPAPVPRVSPPTMMRLELARTGGVQVNPVPRVVWVSILPGGMGPNAPSGITERKKGVP